ncbi:MAG: NUDIX hydrolase [Clostridiales bacterium]|nr:NUDIX hydrolase [Clostridiales bacterium]
MKLSSEDKTFLALYSDSEYEKPSVTVDGVIFRLVNKENDNYRKLPEKKLQVFLSKRSYPPYKDCYGVVGTFIDLKTELTTTMELCIKNKVGLENFYSEQLFTFGEKSRDPRTRVLSVSYMILTSQEEKIENGEWFDINISKITNKTSTSITQEINILLCNENNQFENKLELKIDKKGLKTTKTLNILQNTLAFDHINLIYHALERLKNKLEYTDIIFNLLPKTFTLTELKQSYEEILNEKLLDANFRRKIAKMVVATNDYEVGKGHRSSKYFAPNPTYSFIDID